ncbi:MAG: hypothetical protein JXR46_10730 [Calditrichaceae bacterium]|nr:hypothetical protein [Calditrichaceae bacterium]RQV94534.1 MAG: hypothetical protein EH224_10155 [Calditrichota bacterium]
MKRSIIFILILFLTSFAWPQETSSEVYETKKNSFGFGLGIPYGVLGGNVDINMAPQLNVSIGIGSSIVAGIAYNAGLKYFLNTIEHSFRPRLSAYYGINAISSIADHEETYTGFSLGFGAQWMWGNTKSNGLDFDVIYIVSTGYDIDELRTEYGSRYMIEEYGSVKFSIGYRRAF